MEYMRADQLPFDPRPQMGRIFAEGFYQWLKFFSKDKEKLALSFAHIFDLRCFFTVVQNGEIAAIAACSDGKTPSIGLDKKVLCRTLGFMRGRIAFMMLKKHLVEHPYPFKLSQQTGSIEFVATAQKYRGKGAAYGLIVYIMSVGSYAEYVLEVAETNTAAIRLYEKAGFHEFKRVKAPKGSGEGHFVYMKRGFENRQ